MNAHARRPSRPRSGGGLRPRAAWRGKVGLADDCCEPLVLGAQPERSTARAEGGAEGRDFVERSGEVGWGRAGLELGR